MKCDSCQFKNLEEDEFPCDSCYILDCSKYTPISPKKICKNCKNWKRDKGFHGFCSSRKLIYTGDSYNSEEKCKDTLHYCDAEGYEANFTTGEEFGCIHFEKS